MIPAAELLHTALRLRDAQNDNLDFGARAAWDTLGTFSLVLLVRRSAALPAAARRIASKGDGGGGATDFKRLTLTTSGGVFVAVVRATTNTSYTTTGTPLAGDDWTWLCIAVNTGLGAGAKVAVHTARQNGAPVSQAMTVNNEGSGAVSNDAAATWKVGIHTANLSAGLDVAYGLLIPSVKLTLAQFYEIVKNPMNPRRLNADAALMLPGTDSAVTPLMNWLGNGGRFTVSGPTAVQGPGLLLPQLIRQMPAPVFYGNGAVALPAIALSGTGQQRHTADGAVTLPALVMAGTGTVSGAAITGDGAVTLPALALAGTGQQQHQADGAVTLPALVMAGTGTVSGVPVTGDGAMTIPALAMAGAGQQQHNGTGAVAVPAMVVAGTGQQQHTGTGAVILPALALVATGQQQHTGSGAVTIAAPTLSGTGVQQHTGTGAIVLPGFVVAGAGTAANLYGGSGDVNLVLTLAGVGVVTQTTQATGKYKPEHDGAQSAIDAATGFAAEHVAALRDVGNAGV